MSSHGLTLLPSLGACVRHITLSNYGDKHGNASSRYDASRYDASRYDRVSRDVWLSACNFQMTMADRLLPLVESILRYNKALPHLESLDWEQSNDFGESFANTLISSSVQHLQLRGPIVTYAFELKLPQSLVSRGWPIRTLHLQCIPASKAVDTAGLYTSILHLCAPYLESLVWINHHSGSKDFQTFNGSSLLEFPRLRKLKIVEVRLADTSVATLS